MSNVKRYTVGYYDGEWHVSEEFSDIARGLHTFILAADYDRHIQLLEAEREADKALMDGMQKECADAHNLGARLRTRIELALEFACAGDELSVRKTLDAALKGKNGE